VLTYTVVVLFGGCFASVMGLSGPNVWFTQ